MLVQFNTQVSLIISDLKHMDLLQPQSRTEQSSKAMPFFAEIGDDNRGAAS